MKLGFEGIIPHQAYWAGMNYYDGYSGFDWSDMLLVTKNGIDHLGAPENCGFRNVLHGDAEIYTTGSAYTNIAESYGWMISPSAGATFDLKSGILAAADNSDLIAGFYAFNASGSLTGKLVVDLSNKAVTIDFAKNGAAFKHVYALEFVGYAPGNNGFDGLVMDDLKLHWNGPVPHAHAQLHAPHIHHAVLTNAESALQSGPPDHQTDAEGHGVGPFVGRHAEIMSLASTLGHHGAGNDLTALFALPECHHFGM